MAIQKITYSDKSYINENANIAAVNKVQATDMNEIKSVVNNNANLIYPVGSIITTNTNTNPSSSFGGTWISVICNDIIESGTLVDSDLSYGEYRIYANGDIEAWGFLNAINVNAGAQNNYSITLPYTISNANVVSGLAYGGSNWPWCNIYSLCIGGRSTITISIYATEGLIQNMQPNFYLKGTINLSSNGIATHYSWKRIS